MRYLVLKTDFLGDFQGKINNLVWENEKNFHFYLIEKFLFIELSRVLRIFVDEFIYNITYYILLT